jgi:flagellar hook assembly protein FlgD
MPIQPMSSQNNPSMMPSMGKSEEALKEMTRIKNQDMEKVSKSSHKMMENNFKNWMKVTLATYKRQDPTNPEKPGKMAIQFANMGMAIGFSEMQESFQELLELKRQGQISKANNMEGQFIEMKGNSFRHNAQNPVSLRYQLPKDAHKTHAVILDGDQKQVLAMDVPSEMGRHEIKFDDRALSQLKSGEKYTFQIHAYDKKGSLFKDDKGRSLLVPTTITGKITGGRMENNMAMYVINEEAYPVRDFVQSKHRIQSHLEEDKFLDQISDKQTVDRDGKFDKAQSSLMVDEEDKKSLQEKTESLLDQEKRMKAIKAYELKNQENDEEQSKFIGHQNKDNLEKEEKMTA